VIHPYTLATRIRIMLSSLRLTFPLALALLLLAGCASTPKAPPLSPEQAVTARADQRWLALIEGRWADAYAFLTPGYREAHSLDGFKATFMGSPVRWQSAKVSTVTCEAAERCVANIAVEFELSGGMPGVPRMRTTQQLQESWLLVGGAWHHLPRR
jgi:hypothetical protein